MTEVNFEELLSDQIDTVERPPVFPVGDYDALIVRWELGESSQKGTPYVRFYIKLTGPQENVDEELFEQAGGLQKLNDRREMQMDFYLTADAKYRLREFVENTLELNISGTTFDKILPDTVNLPLTVEINHRKGNKEGEFWMNINDHAKAV